MTPFLGIDGGGSTLRVALVDDGLRVIAEVQRGTANPNIIGYEASKTLVQAAVREVLALADVTIAAAGIGIAGASTAQAWMRALIEEVLPGIPVAPALDLEVALVGAHGARRGVLILAGTGSMAYAINDAGAVAQAGGWGYLLGDEGSGYWLGMGAIRAVTLAADGLNPSADAIARRVTEALALTKPRDVIAWLYRQPPPIKEIAALAPLVLEAAEAGSVYAAGLVADGAAALASITSAVIRQLDAPDLPVAFAGSLLTSDNPLSRALCARLHLTSIPQPLHPPVIGAALLAKLTVERIG